MLGSPWSVERTQTQEVGRDWEASSEPIFSMEASCLSTLLWLKGYTSCQKGQVAVKTKPSHEEPTATWKLYSTYSFFRADFRFSSLTSWLASRSLTSRSDRLAGIMSSSRSLLSYMQKDHRGHLGEALEESLTRGEGGSKAEKQNDLMERMKRWGILQTAAHKHSSSWGDSSFHMKKIWNVQFKCLMLISIAIDIIYLCPRGLCSWLNLNIRSHKLVQDWFFTSKIMWNRNT